MLQQCFGLHYGKDCSCTLSVVLNSVYTHTAWVNVITSYTHNNTPLVSKCIKHGQELVYQQPSLTVAHRIHKHCKREYVNMTKVF